MMSIVRCEMKSCVHNNGQGRCKCNRIQLTEESDGKSVCKSYAPDQLNDRIIPPDELDRISKEYYREICRIVGIQEGTIDDHYPGVTPWQMMELMKEAVSDDV